MIMKPLTLIALLLADLLDVVQDISALQHWALGTLPRKPIEGKVADKSFEGCSEASMLEAGFSKMYVKLPRGP